MNPIKVIKLPVYGIVVTLYENGAGAVTSDLEPPFSDENPVQTIEDGRKDAAYEEGVGVLYTMIQAHASAGIDIESPAYLEGIETAVDSLMQNMN